MRLVSSVIPPPSIEKRRTAVLAAARYALARGVTSVVDLGRWAAFVGCLALKGAEDAGLTQYRRILHMVPACQALLTLQ